jgi:protein tyrosine phosphatase (PTP) superfamily phosphohydrolase (DUF442 family)
MRLPLPRTTRGRWILGVVAVLVAGAALAGWYVDSRWPWYHFRTIVPGKLYRAGQPSADDVAKAVEGYGVKTIVNLRAERTPELEAERKAAEALGARWVDVPLEYNQPPTPEQVDLLLSLYGDGARTPMLFHCQYGTVRCAGVEALFRIEALGESPEEALDNTRTFGRDLEEKAPAIAAWLRSYVPRRARAPR